MNEHSIASPIAFEVPPQNIKLLQAQQAPPIDTDTSLKQFVFQGGLNSTVGTTRYYYFKGRLHLTKVIFSIKAKPTNECITEIGYYNGKSSRPLCRYFHKILVHDVGGDNEDYYNWDWDFTPPLMFIANTVNDYIYIKTDGSSDGEFSLIGFEQVK